MNPGQSVKEPRRPVHPSVNAIMRGELKPGGTIVEGTAGNTGIGLTVVANALGFRIVNRHSRDPVAGEKDALRQLVRNSWKCPPFPTRTPTTT